jgi:uncharacterized protein (DUF433 family)/predicted nuclease of predicted toxin-antitoxin system
MIFTRITIDPAVCTGKPCIRGLRFPVARLLGLLAAGETRDAILKAYPYLEPGDIDEALRYAAFLAEDETIELRSPDSSSTCRYRRPWRHGSQTEGTTHAADVGLHSATDVAIMVRAKQEARTIITADLDYSRLLVLAQAKEPSLILFRDGDWSEADVIGRLSEVLCTLTEADITQSIVVVDRDRVRRRKLPVDG